MPPTTPPAILDWRDPDDQVTPNGAEIDAYASLPSPYKPRNAPFQTVAELLMVQNVPAELLQGEDANFNGLLDPEEDDGNLSDPPDDANGSLNAGWSALLTVNSSTQNNSASGETRLNLNTAEATDLQQIPGITDTIAQAIVNSRANRQMENLLDLLEVRAANPGNPSPPQMTPSPELQIAQPNPTASPQNSTPTGPPLIDESLLKKIADFITTSDQATLPGLVNVNTAPADVLACLPGLDPQTAQAIINHRSSAGFFANITSLLDVPTISTETLRQLAPTITTRSETFRILSEGIVTSSNARKRIELIVHIDASGVDTLAYRDNL
jgi:DNA uptake protein ComE-like DNA-binding protein